MHAKTLEIIEALKNDPSDSIISATYSWAYGRSHTAAAFRYAKKNGIIRQRATGGMNNPIYTNKPESV